MADQVADKTEAAPAVDAPATGPAEPVAEAGDKAVKDHETNTDGAGIGKDSASNEGVYSIGGIQSIQDCRWTDHGPKFSSQPPLPFFPPTRRVPKLMLTNCFLREQRHRVLGEAFRSRAGRCRAPIRALEARR